MKNKFKITSGFIGLATGALIGWYVSGLVSQLLNLDFNIVIYVLMIIFSIVGFVLDLKYPVLIESLSFGITVLIFFQAFWDFGAQDWSKWRSIMSLSAFGLFILNLFTGHLKVNTAKKIIRRQLGIR